MCCRRLSTDLVSRNGHIFAYTLCLILWWGFYGLLSADRAALRPVRLNLKWQLDTILEAFMVLRCNCFVFVSYFASLGG